MVIRVSDIEVMNYDIYNVTVITPDGKTVTYKNIRRYGYMPDDQFVSEQYIGKVVEIRIKNVKDSLWFEGLNHLYLYYDGNGSLCGSCLGIDYDRKMYRYAMSICHENEKLLCFVPDLIRWLYENDRGEEVLRL